MHVNLPVRDSVEEVLCIVLICQVSPIVFQTAVDLILLLLSKELGSLWVVVDNPVSSNGW